jgi:hypothetical protein
LALFPMISLTLSMQIMNVHYIRTLIMHHTSFDPLVWAAPGVDTCHDTLCKSIKNALQRILPLHNLPLESLVVLNL